MYESHQKPNDDIRHGNATVCGIVGGWIIPGRRIIRDRARATMYARRMNRMMGKLGVK